MLGIQPLGGLLPSFPTACVTGQGQCYGRKNASDEDDVQTVVDLALGDQVPGSVMGPVDKYMDNSIL